MQSRTRAGRHWPHLLRVPLSWRALQSARSFSFAIRFLELCLLLGILLAFAAGMMRLR